MNVHHTLICFFFLSLQDGNTEDTNKQQTYHGVIGGNFRTGFSFDDPGNWKIFCKEKCEKNILIKTTDVRNRTGRYSMEYKYENGSPVLYVSIRNLTQSDSGGYRCGLGGFHTPASYRDFWITVGEASVVSTIPATYTTTTTTTERTTTTQSFSSSSGSSTASLTSPGTTEQSVQSQAEGSRSTDVLLYVGLTLAVTIILISVAVLIFCKKRSSKAKDPPVEPEDAAITETGNYEQCTPGSTHEDSAYQTLDLSSKDLNQTYTTLTHYTVPAGEDSTYQALDPARRHQNQTYTTLTHNTVPAGEDSTYQALDPARRHLNQTYFTLTRHI